MAFRNLSSGMLKSRYQKNKFSQVSRNIISFGQNGKIQDEKEMLLRNIT
jgi:hypothetical protein